MKHTFQLTILFALCATLFMAFPSEVSAQPDWDFYDGNWDPMEFQGQWPGDYYLRYGPVVSDLRGCGLADIIVYDEAYIKVYGDDTEEPGFAYELRFQINVSQDGFYQRSRPSVGDINGDGVLDIVYTTNKPIRILYDDGDEDEVANDSKKESFESKVYVIDGSTGNQIASTSFTDIGLYTAMTPAIADIDVLDFDAQNPCYEDGRMEIIFFGLQYVFQEMDPVTGYEEIVWRLKILQLQNQNQLNGVGQVDYNSIDNKELQWIDEPRGEVDLLEKSYLIPAVGDMNNDGKKEIVVNCPIGYACWTFFDPDNNSNNNLTEQFLVVLEDPEDNSSDDHPPFDDSRGFHAIGPILADIDNNGTLEAIILEDNGENSIIVHALDIEGDNVGNWPHDFSGTNLNHVEGVIAGDILHQQNEDDDGTAGIVFHAKNFPQNTDWLRVIDVEGAHIGNATPIAYNTPGIMPSAALLDYDDHSAFLVGGDWSNYDLHTVSIDLGLGGDQFNFGEYSLYSNPIITDLDSDGEFDVVFSTLEDGQNMKVYVWSLNDVDMQDHWPMSLTEWGQFGNGPAHSQLYAQPYTGWLPGGKTYWRGRVIVKGDVYCGENPGTQTVHELWTDHVEPCVVEFDAGAALHVYPGGWGGTVGYTTFEMKENYHNAINNWELVFEENVVWPPDDPGDFVHVKVSNGSVIISEGCEVTLDSWIFTGSGSGTAVTSEDADVTFINCTFDNYATALSLDGGTATFQGCTFTDMTGTVLDIANCTTTNAVTIEECTITGSNGMAIYSYNSQVVVDGKMIGNLAMLD